MEDTKIKLRTLVESMDDVQLGVLADELAIAVESRQRRIMTEDITPERLKDPAFAAELRSEIGAILRGMR